MVSKTPKMSTETVCQTRVNWEGGSAWTCLHLSPCAVTVRAERWRVVVRGPRCLHKALGTVCGDSSGDYLSCLIQSAGPQLGHIMHQRLTDSDYNVVRPDSPFARLLSTGRNVLSELISVIHEIWSFCDDKSYANITFHHRLMLGFQSNQLITDSDFFSFRDWSVLSQVE